MKKYLFLIFAFLLSAEVYTQIPFLKPISLFQGREDYRVNIVHQDAEGWIWFGTNKGLFRYDGIGFEHFTMSDSLAGIDVTAISCDYRGELWIGHKNGKITIYDYHKFRVFRPEEGLGNVEITDIEIDPQGNIWYATMGEGVFRYNRRHLSNLSTDDGLSDNYVYDIEFDADGTMWFGTDFGVSIKKKEVFEIISMKDGLPDNIIRVVKVGSDGKLWFGSEEGGISIYNPKDSSIVNVGGWYFGAVTGFAMNLENELWVSTARHGIIKLHFEDDLSDPTYMQIGEEQGLISNQLRAILKDRESNIWVAGRLGVIQALPPTFEFLDKQSGTPFEMVYSFSIDQLGDYWVCTETGLFKGFVNEYGSINWVNYSSSLNLQGVNFISIYTDMMGDIWAGTYGSGVYRFSREGARFLHLTSSTGLTDDNVIHISGDKEIIWFSTLGGGISGYNIESEKNINIEDELLRRSYVYAAKRDKTGKTWIAGSIEHPSFVEGDSIHYLDELKVSFPQLYGLAFDSVGSVWFNTIDQGIFCLREDSILVFDEHAGIETDEIQSIVFDKWDNLVIISNEGFQFFKPGVGVVRRFGENSGLAYRYPVLNAVFTDSSDNIWIGTETGIIKYNPDYLEQDAGNPKIFLSTKLLFGKPIESDRHSYRYNENNFTFGYTGLWYTNPEAISYRYKLIGYDLDWSYSKRNQPFTYSRLQDGEYTFVAEVSLDGLNWISDNDAQYSFTVKPPIWERAWFIGSMVLLIVLGILQYIRRRLANLKKAKEELELEVKRRTVKIKKQNEELEEQKEEIAAQRDLAENQRDQIEHQNEEIQASIRYAYRIQSAALPPKSYLDKILGDYFILNKPKDIVSGDFFWVASRNDHIFFAVADCTGHGVPGAFMSMLGLSALNDIVKSLDNCMASEILSLLSERVRESLHQGEHEGKGSQDGMDISLCILEPKTGELQFAAAHNDLYVIRDDEILKIPSDNRGIGSELERGFCYSNQVLKLKKGDVLYMFSDGFPDQFGGPNGKKYKYKPFREFLMKIHKEAMEDQRNMLDEEIENWRGEHPQIDDIIIMGVRKE